MCTRRSQRHYVRVRPKERGNQSALRIFFLLRRLPLCEAKEVTSLGLLAEYEPFECIVLT